jgi:hypothetical protein
MRRHLAFLPILAVALTPLVWLWLDQHAPSAAVRDNTTVLYVTAAVALIVPIRASDRGQR